MITLAKRLKKNGDSSQTPERQSNPSSFRDALLPRQVAELTPEVLPPTAQVEFPDPDVLYKFLVHIKPTEGYWRGGRFIFEITVPDDYNMSPPKARCKTTIWHPNIHYTSGAVCLSLLRKTAVDDGMGWTPTRSLKDIVLGLDGLFGDLVNFDDPLNIDAAQEFRHSPELFERRVRDHAWWRHKFDDWNVERKLTGIELLTYQMVNRPKQGTKRLKRPWQLLLDLLA